MDDWAFSRNFTHIDSVDSDFELNELVTYNLKRLQVKQINRISSSAEEFLKECVSLYDLIYIDADRRPSPGKREFLIEQAKPDIIGMLPHLFKLSDNILLKLSPMLDIQAIFRGLPGVNHIWVISLKNEVKEVLVLLSKEHCGQPKTTAVDLDGKGNQMEYTKKETPLKPDYAIIGEYFYEPGLSLIKSGLAQEYMAEESIHPVSPHVFYGVSKILCENFFGRTFKIISCLTFSKAAVNEYLKTKAITKANISERNFPVTPDELKKSFRLKDGGNEYLFFYTDQSGNKLMAHCSKNTDNQGI